MFLTYTCDAGSFPTIITARPGAELYFPLSSDEDERDRDCYRPLERAVGRLHAACAEAGCDMETSALRGRDERSADIAFLAKELYAYPPRSHAGAPENVCLRFARDPREECMLAAATCRKLAWRA